MPGFVLHPEAYTDLDESGNTSQLTTWTLLTAFSKRFTKQSAPLLPFPTKVTLAPTSLLSRYDFNQCGTM